MYNLNIENSGILHCSGILVGDYIIQYQKEYFVFNLFLIAIKKKKKIYRIYLNKTVKANANAR